MKKSTGEDDLGFFCFFSPGSPLPLIFEFGVPEVSWTQECSLGVVEHFLGPQLELFLEFLRITLCDWVAAELIAELKPLCASCKKQLLT